MTLHNYFGQVKNDLQGFSSEKTLEIPYFETYNKTNFVKVYFVNQYDEEWKKIEILPTEKQLDQYEKTIKNFLTEIDNIIIDIQQKSFENYQKIYAKYYEVDFEILSENNKIKKPKNGILHPPLNVDSKEKHFEYMKEILGYILVTENNTIIIPLSYYLDEEHGLEIKVVNNKVEKVDGIGETY